MTEAPAIPLPRSGEDVAIEALTAKLVACRNQFQMYGDSHAAKEPPQIEKARVNYAFVNEINLVILHAAEMTAQP